MTSNLPSREADRRALSVADLTLNGRMDPLVACRQLAELRNDLCDVPDEVMTVFVAVASETHDLPLGAELDLWAKTVAQQKQVEADVYREKVRDVILAAVRDLRTFLRA